MTVDDLTRPRQPVVPHPGPAAGRHPEGSRPVPTLAVLPAFLFASLMALEVVLRVQTGTPVLTVGLVHAALFAAVTALLVHLAASLVTGVARIVVVVVSMTMLTLLHLSQLIYFDIFRTFYTVYSATNAGQVVEFADGVLGRAVENAGWLLLLLVPLVLLVAGRHRIVPGDQVSWGHRGAVAGLAALLFGATVVGINLGDTDQNSAYDMYYREYHPVVAVQQLGLVTSMRVDLQRNLLGLERQAPPPPVTSAPAAPAEDEPGAAQAPAGAATGEGGGGQEPGPGSAPPADAATDPGVHVLDIDFARLIEEAESEELAHMHHYFSSRVPSAKNEHTGLFEGYNLVFVTAEAYSHLAVDPDVTPTLHMMTQDGYTFADAYTPIWGVSTSDGEYVATTGLIPKSGVWSMFQSGDNAMPFAMGNQLRRLGYETYAYHNHTYDYYRRDVSHPNLGYDYKGLGNGLEVTPTWPASDVEMIDLTTEQILASEPFHAYYMTVSGHLEYNFGGNFIAAKNRELVQDLPYTEAGKAYLATQVELDRALELLLDRLDEAGVADRTLIVMSSDHYPYGLTHEQIEDLAGHEVDGSFELYRNSILMYARGMEPQTVEEPVSSLDIIPTLSNLLGLEFDSRLLMGRDVFSDTDPLVIFSNRSFITDQGRYDSLTREFTPHEGQEVDDTYRQSVSEEIDRRFYYSTQILDRDYYDLVVDR